MPGEKRTDAVVRELTREGMKKRDAQALVDRAREAGVSDRDIIAGTRILLDAGGSGRMGEIAGLANAPGARTAQPSLNVLNPETPNVPEDAIRRGADALKGVARIFNPIPESAEALRPASAGAGALMALRLAQRAPNPIVRLAAQGLGAAAGSLGLDAAQTGASGGQGGFARPVPLREGLRSAGREALFELGGITGGEAVASGARSVFRAIASIDNPESQRLIAQAMDQGIPMGIADVTGNQVIRRGVKALGRFPFIGRGPQRIVPEKVKGIERAGEALVEKFGPVSTFAGLSTRTVETAGESFRIARNTVDRAYEVARAAARDSGSVQIPTAPIREAANDVLDQLAGSARAPLRGGKKNLPVRGQKTIRELQKLASLEDAIDVRQFETLSDDLNDLIELAKGRSNEMRLLLGLKQASEQAFRQMDGPQEIVRLFERADRLYFGLMKIYETPTAKRFGRADRNIFRPRFEEPGVREADLILKDVFRSESPQAIRDLRRILLRKRGGQEVWRQAVGDHFQSMFDSARKNITRIEGKEVISFDTDKIRKQLGIGSPSSSTFEATQKMLQGTGVTMDQLKRFLNAVDNAFPNGVPDPSTFLARRSVLGGLRSGAIGILGGLGFAEAPVMGVALILGTRRTGTILSEPRFLRAAIDSLNPNLTMRKRVAANRRLFREAGLAGLVSGLTGGTEGSLERLREVRGNLGNLAPQGAQQ